MYPIFKKSYILEQQHSNSVDVFSKPLSIPQALRNKSQDNNIRTASWCGRVVFRWKASEQSHGLFATPLLEKRPLLTYV